MRLIIIFISSLLCLSAEAEIVSEELRRQVGFNLRFIQETGADSKRQERSAWGVGWSEPIWERLRLESGFFWAPDQQNLPRAVKIHDDWLGLYAGAEWSHPWFFRWFVASGLIGQYEKSTIRISLPEYSQHRIESRYQMYPYFRGGIDYAMSKDFEIRFELGTQKRSTASQLDWFWGISFGYNIP